MPTSLRTVCFIVALVLAGTPLGRADEPAAKIKVLLIDGQNNHNWRATTPVVKEALEKTGRFTVTVSSNLKEGDKPGNVKETTLFPPDLDAYEVVVSNYNGAAWPTEFQKSFDEHVKSGKLGLVVFHAADNAFSGWPEYNLMIGMGWRGNSFGENIFYNADGKAVRVPKGEGRGAGETGMHAFRVTLRNGDHPITKGMPPEWMHTADQLVHGLRGPAENVEVLATAFSDKEKRGTGDHELMMWTVAYGKGRVFHTPMGHDVGSVRCVGFLTALSRGTEWAATGKVTLPIPDNFPTAEKTSAVSEK
jgi:type 1 glutamine amidotransferase